MLTFFCLDALNNNCKVVFFRNFNNEERLLDKSLYVKIISRSTKGIINHVKKELTHGKRKNFNSKFKILLNEKQKTIDLVNKYFNKNII